MTPEKLYLKGFAGICDGMGLQEYTLDLTQLPEDARLIAIAGPNGAGKSTLMDNLTPFRLLPSRAGSFSAAGFSMYEHLSLPEAMKELIWRHEGYRYRSSLVWRVNGKRKAEAFLHVEEGGHWQAVRLADGTVSDGKTETYDACVEALLGKAEVFFNSVFAAQNRRQLSALRPAEMKALMVELLGLEAIQDKGRQATQVVSLLKHTLEDRRRSLRELGEPHETVLQARSRFDLSERDIATHERARQTLCADLAAAQQTVARLSAQRAAGAETQRRREALEASIAHERLAAAQALQQLRQDQAREAARAKAALEARSKAIAELRGQLGQLPAARASVQSLLARKDAIVGAKARLVTLIEDEHAAAAAVEHAQVHDQTLQAEATALALAKGELANARMAQESMAQRSEDLKKRCALSMTVPCHGTDLQPRCLLLSDAHEAQARLPGVEGSVNQIRARIESLQGNVQSREARLAALGDTAVALAAARKRVEVLLGERRQLETLAASEEALGQAEARLTEYARVEEDCTRKLGEIEHAEAKSIADEKALMDAMAKRIRDREEQGQGRLHALAGELASLPPAFDPASTIQAETALREVAARLQKTDVDSVQAVRARADALAVLQVARANAEKAVVLKEGIKHIEVELATWSLLAKALSKDGVIALCIDDAGPELSRLANSLLLACYGPRFTLRIDTQVETAKAELREGFDITVFDADSGQSKSLDVMSGGQRVWINECLTRAIALYVAESSSRRYETLFSDEADGPLDPKRKRMFMAMKREVLRSGGYGREFFISQTPELVEMADAVVDLSEHRMEETATRALN